MKKPQGIASASASVDARIKELRDWRGTALAKIRALIHAADPEVVEEVKWMGTPVWSHAGIICTGETYKAVVKMTFMKGAKLKDPSRLFNASLDGNARRAIDIREGDVLNEGALKALIKEAVALNLADKSPTERPVSTATSRKETASERSMSKQAVPTPTPRPASRKQK